MRYISALACLVCNPRLSSSTCTRSSIFGDPPFACKRAQHHSHRHRTWVWGMPCPGSPGTPCARTERVPVSRGRESAIEKGKPSGIPRCSLYFTVTSGVSNQAGRKGAQQRDRPLLCALTSSVERGSSMCSQGFSKQTRHYQGPKGHWNCLAAASLCDWYLPLQLRFLPLATSRQWACGMHQGPF